MGSVSLLPITTQRERKAFVPFSPPAWREVGGIATKEVSATVVVGCVRPPLSWKKSRLKKNRHEYAGLAYKHYESGSISRFVCFVCIHTVNNSLDSVLSTTGMLNAFVAKTGTTTLSFVWWSRRYKTHVTYSCNKILFFASTTYARDKCSFRSLDKRWCNRVKKLTCTCFKALYIREKQFILPKKAFTQARRLAYKNRARQIKKEMNFRIQLQLQWCVMLLWYSSKKYWRGYKNNSFISRNSYWKGRCGHFFAIRWQAQSNTALPTRSTPANLCCESSSSFSSQLTKQAS